MAVKLDKESGCVIDDVVEMREVMVRTGSDRCTLVIDMTINIYMNDLYNVSEFLFTILYADDTCVLLHGKNE